MTTRILIERDVMMAMRTTAFAQAAGSGAPL